MIITILALLERASKIQPSTQYKIYDTFSYESAKGTTTRPNKPVRTTEVTAWSSEFGEGSHEAIKLQMEGDDVRAVEVGQTVTYWQAFALVRAHSELSHEQYAEAARE